MNTTEVISRKLWFRFFLVYGLISVGLAVGMPPPSPPDYFDRIKVSGPLEFDCATDEVFFQLLAVIKSTARSELQTKSGPLFFFTWNRSQSAGGRLLIAHDETMTLRELTSAVCKQRNRQVISSDCGFFFVEVGTMLPEEKKFLNVTEAGSDAQATLGVFVPPPTELIDIKRGHLHAFENVVNAKLELTRSNARSDAVVGFKVENEDEGADFPEFNFVGLGTYKELFLAISFWSRRQVVVRGSEILLKGHAGSEVLPTQ